LDIKLLPVEEVLQVKTDSLDKIQLDTPIDLNLSKFESQVKKEVNVNSASVEVSLNLDALPKTGTSSEVEISPKVDTSLQAKDLPQIETGFQVQSSPQIEISSQVESSSQIEISPQVDLTPQIEISPQIELSSNIESTKSLELKVESPQRDVPLNVPQGESLQIELSQEASAPVESKKEKIETSSLNIDLVNINTNTSSSIEVQPFSDEKIEASIQIAPVKESDLESAELPYLFSEGGNTNTSIKLSEKLLEEKPVSISISNESNSSSEVDTLKNYLTMREQDIAVLKVQLSYARDELKKNGDTIRFLSSENEDLKKQIESLKRKADDFDSEKKALIRTHESEVEKLKQELKEKIEKINVLEDKLKNAEEESERFKERVRLDLRKIRVREKELESKLEILKKDSEMLVASREAKIIELKRRVDLLEFNIDVLTEKNEKSQNRIQQILKKQEEVQGVLKLALNLLSEENLSDEELKKELNVNNHEVLNQNPEEDEEVKIA
jgi:hypothetical protein